MNTAVALFHELYEAINLNDLDRTLAVYAPDVHYTDPAFGQDLHSRQELRGHLGPWFDTADLAVEMTDAFTADHRVVSAWWFSGTITRELPGVWDRDAVGRSFSVPGLTVATRTRDGMLGEVVEYRDLNTLLEQLGVALPVAVGGEK